MAQRPAAATIKEALRADIISGKCAPGEPLQEEEIAAEFKVSRTPIREALRGLEFEGLVKVVPKRGTFVREITARDVTEIFEIRIAFETFAVRTGGEQIDRQELLELRDRLREIEQDPSLARGDHSTVDSELHRLIVGAFNNRRVTEMFDRHAVQIARLRALSWTVSERWHEAIAEHLQIIELLLEGDRPAAEKALTAHLTKGRQTILSILSTEGP